MPPEAFQTAFCLVSADGTAAVIRTSGINFQTRNGTPSTARTLPAACGVSIKKPQKQTPFKNAAR
ncbi:hypothetical protein V5G04_00180 [Neisseria gonorrhoeae]|uniref:hypothetical protein n=1 Tax=Neisseria gonorrhoeae TaxID=485 RepID=UPI00064C7F66|nr:hypothetical protein [Neisseria gonorrhoeae]